MSGDGRRLPAQCSPDGALVPPEIRCPVSDLPVSRAQTPSSMAKCRCEKDVKRALCRSRGAGRSESSSAATATPSQLKGHAQVLRFGAIPGEQAPRPTGSSRVPTGPTRGALGARSPGAEQAHGSGR
ncbi:hypothetical protein NDU88_003292 [Pleurodeles waltl]|uniref:Uncharacterized protein n=1 Tax=Pleurodeles waltl TaxID=8319 RepID=A0AAV7SEV6_PLEWA|nr:hypothetical protein NDU88_003292 [Pleurodeles waltl]